MTTYCVVVSEARPPEIVPCETMEDCAATVGIDVGFMSELHDVPAIAGIADQVSIHSSRIPGTTVPAILADWLGEGSGFNPANCGDTAIIGLGPDYSDLKDEELDWDDDGADDDDSDPAPAVGFPLETAKAILEGIEAAG